MIGCIFFPIGLVHGSHLLTDYAIGFAAYAIKLAVGGVLLGVFESAIAKMRVFRVPNLLGAALMLGLLGTLLLYVSRGL
jgi:formate hydrogenlyase subunit 4